MKEAHIPEWLLRSGEGERLATPPGAKPKGPGFLEKTLESFAEIMREEIQAEKLAGRKGLLQGIHPGVKVLTTLLLIIVAALLRHPSLLILLNLWIVLMAYLSEVPLTSFWKRVWLVVPLFTGIIVLPSIFNFVRPGTPLLVLAHFSHPLQLGPWLLPRELAITSQGVGGAIVLILRVGSCVSLVFLLTICTRWHLILKAFRSLHVPRIFVTILEMSYRYIFLLVQTAAEMLVARKSRTVGKSGSKEERRFISGALGSLWNHSYYLSEEVHAVMVSRGYTGEPKTMETIKTSTIDWLWGAFMLAVSILILWGDQLLG